MTLTFDPWPQHCRYNNQWMIVDYKKFQPVQPGLLYVVEQIPGMVEYADRTTLLQKQHYWPSYNSPWVNPISNIPILPEAFLILQAKILSAPPITRE